MQMMIGNRKVTKIITGGQVIWDKKNDWRRYVDESPSGIFKQNSFLYLLNEKERYVSIYFTGDKDGLYNKNDAQLFDMSWLIKGITSIDMAISDAQITSMGVVGVTLSFSGTRVMAHGLDATNDGNAVIVNKDFVGILPDNYSEPRIYYTELV